MVERADDTQALWQQFKRLTRQGDTEGKIARDARDARADRSHVT